MFFMLTDPKTMPAGQRRPSRVRLLRRRDEHAADRPGRTSSAPRSASSPASSWCAPPARSSTAWCRRPGPNRTTSADCATGSPPAGTRAPRGVARWRARASALVLVLGVGIVAAGTPARGPVAPTTTSPQPRPPPCRPINVPAHNRRPGGGRLLSHAGREGSPVGGPDDWRRTSGSRARPCCAATGILAAVDHGDRSTRCRAASRTGHRERHHDGPPLRFRRRRHLRSSCRSASRPG